MQFKQLAELLDQIEAESKRLVITRLLATLWPQLADNEIWPVANLIQGRLRPPYEQLVFGLSEKMIQRAAVSLATQAGGLSSAGLSVDLFGVPDEDSLTTSVRQIYRRYGDWGAAIGDIHSQLSLAPATPLTLTQVYDQLVAIARLAGDGAHAQKIAALVRLYQSLDATSSKIITRMVIGKLRLGFSAMTILDSLSWALTGDKSESDALEEIWQKKADLGLLARQYLSRRDLPSAQRLAELRASYTVQAGIPLIPALCQRLNSTADIIDKMDTVIAEPKYDGMRLQIHVWHEADQLRYAAFTRSLENVTAMFPELAAFAASLAVDNVIFDSETVGFDAAGHMLPFQDTITRRRIHDVAAKAQQITMKFFIFDLLLLDNRDLLSVPLRERKQILSSVLPSSTSGCELGASPEFITTDSPQVLTDFHHAQLAAGLEGMVVKGVDTRYQSGRKGWNWVKIKEEEGTRGKLNDTLDLVVMGLYHGRGKRHDLGTGAFLAGVRDDATGEFYTVSKIGTGLTDEQLRGLRQQTAPLVSATCPSDYHVDKLLTPDVWLQPHLVAEVAADEISRSKMHTSGVGLRFPRLLRWRTDKTAAQATTTAELSQIKISTGDDL
ncbi:ATP-dependent DNA ligase [bacterium]|nr:ATP-dependent DNA ligase [bacterium]